MRSGARGRAKKTPAGKEAGRLPPAMDLIHHAPAEQAGDDRIDDVPPISLGVQRSVEMNRIGASSQQEQRKPEGAEDEAHQFLQGVFPAPLAADLEMQQLEVPRQIE